MLDAKVRELEDTVKAKFRIISLLKDEAKLSQNEIDNLRQSQCHSSSAPSGTPARTPPQSGTPSQSGTLLSGITQLGTDSLPTHVDRNSNLHPQNSTSATPVQIGSLLHPSTPSPHGSKASNTETSRKDSNYSPRNNRNCEKFCQNCLNELHEDLNKLL